MQLDEILQTLYTNRLMKDSAEVIKFEEGLANLSSLKELSRNDVYNLLQVFHDETEHHEVMWGLLHLVERVPMQNYVWAVVGSIDSLKVYAPEWLETIIFRIINDHRYRDTFVANVSKLDRPSMAIIKAYLVDLEGGAPAKSVENIREAISKVAEHEI